MINDINIAQLIIIIVLLMFDMIETKTYTHIF